MPLPISTQLLCAIAIAAAIAGCGGNTASDSPSSTILKSGIKTADLQPSPPTLGSFELVADDGNAGKPISNDWGRNQPRVTRHNDGTLRVLYLPYTTDGKVHWTLMKRPAGATTWQAEETGVSTDDVVLLRDPQTDLAYVIAFPDSAPTAYASPGFAPSAIGSGWQVFSGRHYGGVGIGSDGRVCLKASLESDTVHTQTHYICGKYDGISAWSWGSKVTRAIGERHAYDYLFPGGYGDLSRLIASSQSDVLKSATIYKDLGGIDYVFNGARQYQTGIASASDAEWSENELFGPYSPMAVPPPPAPPPSAPLARQLDSFIDSRGRMFSSYFVDSSSAARGFYLAVTNAHKDALYDARWTQLPAYGEVRIFEDGSHRLWLLWTASVNKGNFILYPIVENATTHAFSLGTGTDLSADLQQNWLVSTQLAVPRGGQVLDDKKQVDGILVACPNPYKVPNTGNVCDPDNTGKQRIFHFTIKLPD